MLCILQPVFLSMMMNQVLHHDYKKWLESLALHEPVSEYRHNDTGEDNADAHMKRQVMWREVIVAVTNGKLNFGPWEQIFYGNFNGRRKKEFLLKLLENNGEPWKHYPSIKIKKNKENNWKVIFKELQKRIINLIGLKSGKYR